MRFLYGFLVFSFSVISIADENIEVVGQDSGIEQNKEISEGVVLRDPLEISGVQLRYDLVEVQNLVVEIFRVLSTIENLQGYDLELIELLLSKDQNDADKVRNILALMGKKKPVSSTKSVATELLSSYIQYVEVGEGNRLSQVVLKIRDQIFSLLEGDDFTIDGKVYIFETAVWDESVYRISFKDGKRNKVLTWVPPQ